MHALTQIFSGLSPHRSSLASSLVYSGLPAVMQSLARKNEWPLDKVNLTVDVTKKFKEEFNQPAREGAYVYGLYMEGRGSLSSLSCHPYPLFKFSVEQVVERTKCTTT